MQMTLLAFSVTKEPKCQERKYSCIYFSKTGVDNHTPELELT